MSTALRPPTAPTPQVSDARYWAFISYSHADERWATWVHRSLETYKVPRPLVGTKGPDGVTVRPARLFPLFRDRDELASASSLSDQIEAALRASRNLIVICSPRAARSRWVNEEVKAFKAMGREDRVFCLIVDGEPEECFPEAVRFGVDAERRITAEPGEPIAADARPDKDGRRHALLKLLAGILDVGFDNLRLRDQERRMRQYAVAGAVLLAAVVAFAAIAWYALRQRDTAVREARAGRAVTSGQMAMSSRLIFAASPPRSLLLAVAALQVTEAMREPRIATAEEALREALAQAGGAVFPGWEEKTAALGLSPNGRWLAAAADGTGSRLWDLSAGGDLSPPIELGGGGGPVAFSPDNRWLVTMGGEDEPARLWDLTRPDPRAGPHRLEQARGPVAWSADRRWLVTAGADRSVRLWRLGAQGASAPLTLPPQENRDTVLAVSPDSRWLVTSSWDPEPHGGATDAARLWDLAAEHPELTGRELPGNTSSISHVAFSPDGHWLATGSAEYDRHTFRQDHTVYLWDLTKKASTAAPVRLQGHEGSITAMAISPDSRWLATGSGDKTARLWDLTAADPAAEPLVFGGHENRVTGVAFGPDSRWLVTLTGPPQWHDSLVPYTPMARLWDLREESPAPRAAVFEDHGRAVAVSTFKLGPGGRFLALVAGSTAYVLDLSSNRPAESARVLRGHEGEVTAAAFGQEGRVLVTASLDSTLRLWHLTTVQPAASPLVVSAGEDELFAVSPDNRWLVTLDGNDAVLWDLRARDIVARPVFLHGHEGPVFDAAFSPDSRWLATGSSDQTARLWRLDGKPPGATSLVLRGHTGVVDRVAFSRDGRRLATGSFDETVRLWDLTRSDRPPGSQVLQADGPVFRLAFSADGRRLLASGSGAPRLWDLTARDPRASPRSLPDGDQAALLSPDSHWLVTFGNDAKRALRKTIDHTQDERQRFELEKRWQGMAATTTLWDLTAEPAPARRVLAKAGEPEAFSPTGRWLLTRGTDDAPRLWPLSAADPTAAPIELRAAGSLAAAAFRPDDRQLVTASYEGAARWWDLTAPDIDRTSRALPRRYGFSGGIVFNADGRWLLGFDPKGATLWEVQADVLAPEPVSLPTQDHPVSGASFTPDGRWLITRSHGSPSGDTVSLWPLRLADLTALACRTAGREFKTIEWKQYFPGQTPRKVCAPS